MPKGKSARASSGRATVQDALDILSALGKLVGRPEPALRDPGDGTPTVPGTRGYGSLQGLTAVQVDSPAAVTVYVRDGRVVLAYLPELPVAAPRLIKRLGAPEADWRSRAGKRYLHHVYASQGLAFSSEPDGTRLAIVERFQPCSLEQYAATFYDDPGQFSE